MAAGAMTAYEKVRTAGSFPLEFVQRTPVRAVDDELTRPAGAEWQGVLKGFCQFCKPKGQFAEFADPQKKGKSGIPAECRVLRKGHGRPLAGFRTAF
jgi:hypothetical protein